MALDLAPILHEAGLPDRPSTLKIALRDESGQVLFGDEAVFEQEPIVQTDALEGGRWTLATVPVHRLGGCYRAADMVVALSSASSPCWLR